MSDGGKGSAKRPQLVSDAQYAERWDLIFARDTEKEENISENNEDDNTESTEAR